MESSSGSTSYGGPVPYGSGYPTQPQPPYSSNSQHVYPQPRIHGYLQQSSIQPHQVQYANANIYHQNGAYQYPPPGGGALNPGLPQFYGHNQFGYLPPPPPPPPPPFPPFRYPLGMPPQQRHSPPGLHVLSNNPIAPTTHRSHSPLPVKPASTPHEDVNDTPTDQRSSKEQIQSQEKASEGGRIESPLPWRSPDREDGEVSDVEVRTAGGADKISIDASAPKIPNLANADQAEPMVLDSTTSQSQKDGTLEEIETKEFSQAASPGDRPDISDSAYQGSSESGYTPPEPKPALAPNDELRLDVDDQQTYKPLDLEPHGNENDFPRRDAKPFGPTWDGNTKSSSHPQPPVKENISNGSHIASQLSNPHDLRKEAKAALKLLHGNQIGPESLIHEGLDLGILEDLYHELGLEFHRGNDHARISDLQQHPKKVDLAPKENSTENATPHSTRQACRSGAADDHTPHLISDENSHPLPPKQARNVVRSSNEPNVTKKPTTVSEKVLDRKDYIAKLLAAKSASKPARLVEDSKVIQSTASSTEATASQSTALNTTSSQASPSAREPGDMASVTKKPEPKDSSQTARVRQRLEALKKVSSTAQPIPKQVLQRQSESVAPALHPRKDPTTGMVSSSTSHPQGQYGPLNPFFASLDHGQPGLPGLGPPSSNIPGLDDLMAEAASKFQNEEAEMSRNLVVGEGDAARHQQLSISRNLDDDLYEPKDMIMSSAAPDVSTQQEDNPHMAGVEGSGGEPLAMLLSKSSKIVTVSQPHNEQQTSHSEQPMVLVSEPRKRAVAADFIDAPSPRSRRKLDSADQVQLVIHVSDDDEDVDSDSADFEPDGQTAKSTTTLKSKSTPGNGKELRGLPPLSSLPSRGLSQPSSSSHTPPIVQLAGKVVDARELERREAEIREMNQKIAELTRRITKKGSSGSGTPQAEGSQATADQRGPHISPETSQEANTLERSREALETTDMQTQLQHTLAATESAVAVDLQKDLHAQATVLATAQKELQQAAMAPTQAEKDFRLSRRALLEAALPKLDSQINRAKTRLLEVRRQQEHLEAEIQLESQGRQKIMDELNELLATSDENQALSRDAPTIAVSSSSKATHDTQEASSTPSSTPSDHPKSPRTGQHQQTDQQPALTQVSEKQASIPFSSKTPASPSSNKADTPNNMPLSKSGEMETNHSDVNMDPPCADDEAIQESREPARLSLPDMEEEMDYEPMASFEDSSADVLPIDNQAKVADGLDRASPALQLQHPSHQDSPIAQPKHSPPQQALTVQNQHPSPQEPSQSTDLQSAADVQRSDNSSESEEGEISQPQEQHDQVDQDEDMVDYEPPEPVPCQSADEGSRNQDTLVAVISSESIQNPSPPTDTTLPPQSEEVHEISLEGDSLSSKSEVDRAANSPEGQPDIAIAPQILAGHQEATSKPGRFRPYESPLKMFTSYRYHPDYRSNISGGYRSLTFSNKIKPQEPLCERELRDGVCRDPSCNFQHLETAKSSDDEILQAMSAIREGNTVDQQSAYIAGLKAKLNSLYVAKRTDFESIAEGIVQYRAEVLQDSTRVLANI